MNKARVASIVTTVLIVAVGVGGMWCAVVAQNAKWVGDTIATPVVLNLDDFNGIDVVWHGGKLHLRPDQIAHIAYRLSLTCDPECAQ